MDENRTEQIFLDETWQQINPQRSISADSFKQGAILFNFNVSGLNSVSLKDSYFMIESSLTGPGPGKTPHVVTDKIAYAHLWACCLFSNASVRVSGQEVSASNQYMHLASAVKLRSQVDENKIVSNLRDAFDYDVDFTRRLNRHTRGSNAAAPATNPTQREDGLLEQSNKAPTNIRGGDTTRYTIYQPPLGVFDLGHGALCGDISIMLNPNPNYETYCVESAKFGTTGGADEDNLVEAKSTDYTLSIKNITFYACYAKASKPIDSVKTFTIHELQVMSKPYAPQVEFNVVPSTEMITAFIQDMKAGSSTIIPATSFKTRQYKHGAGAGQLATQAQYFGKMFTPDENASIQITLGATTKPPILLEPSVNKPDTSGQVIRWLMNHQYLQGHKSVWERYNDWCASPYFTYDFMRDSSDTSGYVTIRSKYVYSTNLAGVTATDWPDQEPPYIFCVSKYSKIVRIEYNSGYVTAIQIQNS